MGKLAYFTFQTANEKGGAARTQPRLQVWNPVADHVALVKACVQVPCRLFQQSNLRLTTPTGLSELRGFCFRVMKTVIDLIDSASRLPNRAQHHILENLEGALPHVSFGDTRLIRDNCRFKT